MREITKNPKRMHLNEEEDSDNDTQALLTSSAINSQEARITRTFALTCS